MTDISSFKAWYDKHAKQIQDDFFTLLRFPSISTDPKHKSDVQNAAKWVKEYLGKVGMKAEMWETSHHPVVFASHCEAGPSRPTVLFYSHYDVQPVDPLDQWKSGPFDPTVRDGQVYARGAVDDKGQCFYTICALQALLEISKKLNVNVKLFIEGEEECGSVGSAQVLKTKKKELQADHLLIVDMGIPAPGTPAITIGLRGIATMQVTCRNSKTDLHSGMLGGIALNPNRALACALAKLWDDEGRVAVPGFYDGVAIPSKEELSLLDQTCDTQELKKMFGIGAFQGDAGHSLWESNTVRPTVEINGMSGGYAGAGFKTVIPAAAIAKISCRLVPHQDPERVTKLIADFLKKNVAPGIDLTVEWDHGDRAVRSSPEAPIAKVAAQAYEDVFQKPCRRVLSGGSVPIVAALKEACGGEAAMIGVGLVDDAIHAPNEHFGLDRFEQGFLTICRIVTLLGNT